MKTFALALIVLGLSFAAAPVGAQDAGQTSFTLLSATGNVWTAEGHTGNNPTLTVPASTAITVTAKNADGGVHNLKIGSGETKPLENMNDEITYEFTSPASGTVEYICTIHASTMKGNFRVAGSGADENGGDGENGAPGFGLVAGLLVLAGVALYMRRS